jgi:RNA polymerase sigma-70 factor (ECF subfamily)
MATSHEADAAIEGPSRSREPSDGELARGVQGGDRGAFELLARRYYRPILAIVASYLREPADVEDTVQEAFLRALDRIQTFDPGRPFAPWLYQVARNVARNRRMAEARRGAPLSGVVETVEATDPGPAARAERARLRELIDGAIEQLPERQRMAFRLFDVEGYSAAEIGEVMGLSAATVRSNVYHARRALRARLAPHLAEGSER